LSDDDEVCSGDCSHVRVTGEGVPELALSLILCHYHKLYVQCPWPSQEYGRY
jgi:hypothetical protein